jgi:hypothetical protein
MLSNLISVIALLVAPLFFWRKDNELPNSAIVGILSLRSINAAQAINKTPIEKG